MLYFKRARIEIVFEKPLTLQIKYEFINVLSHPSILQFMIAHTSSAIYYTELKLALKVQIIQLFQLWT